MKLNNTTAVITGSTGRLGSAIALALAKAGCNCLCHYHKNKQRAADLVKQVQSLASNALAVAADLTNPNQIEHLFEKAKAFDSPQILINSAAVFSKQPLNEVNFQETQEILNLNLTAAILTSREFAEMIKEKFHDAKTATAKIINISDIGGIRPWANYVVYCSSKAGLIGATKALAKELAPAVCVNSVAPGLLNWPDDPDEDEKKRQLALIPMARIAEPKDVTDAIIFLLKNDYITGQVLNVDGGRCI